MQKNNLYITDSGQLRHYKDVELVEKIIKLKNNKDHWAVIDELIKVWADKAGDEVEALQININEYRETLIDKKFGQTKGGQDMERRFTLSFPKTLMLYIRTIYKPEELEFDNSFFREFAKKYPWFRVAEKN